jgi:hypothetical protein
VSKRSTFLPFPSPETKALEWLDLFEPSITFIYATGTLAFSASAKIASLSSSYSRSVILLKSGTITIG